MITHNFCFGAKIRTIGISLQTPFFFYIKVGFKGVYISRTCFADETNEFMNLLFLAMFSLELVLTLKIILLVICMTPVYFVAA